MRPDFGRAWLRCASLISNHAMAEQATFHHPSFGQSLLVSLRLKKQAFCTLLSELASRAGQAGACAGTAVDLLFFPLDTLKTRLQASKGFVKSGGFKGVYRGVGSVLVGSAPGGV